MGQRFVSIITVRPHTADFLLLQPLQATEVEDLFRLVGSDCELCAEGVLVTASGGVGAGRIGLKLFGMLIGHSASLFPPPCHTGLRGMMV